MCLSDAALDAFRKEDPGSAIFAEAVNNAHNRNFSSFLCLLSLSSVLKLPIESYYPIGDDSSMDSLSVMFNCTIYPREWSTTDDEEAAKIHIFRCAILPLDYLENRVIPEAKNHYVSLCKPEPSSLNEFSLTPVHPMFSFPCNSFPNHAETANSIREKPSTSTCITSISRPANSSGKGKLKQTLLDRIFTKRRKVSEEVFQQPEQMDVDKQKEPLSAGPFTDEEPMAPTSTSVRDISHPTSCTSRFGNDVANFLNRTSSLTEQQKYHLLCNVWRPEAAYNFPVNASGRRFQHQWLTKFSWLVYSEVLDGAFCINCLLFGGESTHNATKLKKLFKEPLNAWSTALQKLREHVEKSPIHHTSTICTSQFKLYMQQKIPSIDVQLDGIRKKQVQVNRAKLRPIVDAVILCGRQNIPLRGHRDDSKHLLDSKLNPGNFQEILKYGNRCANISSDDHLKSTPKNASYKSKTTQNELIDICGQLIMEKIVSEIKLARFFSILADEATDCANIEQMSLVVRFVDALSNIREEFLGFVPCKLGLSGEAIAATISSVLRQLDLPLDLCRGQGYDGAGNMAGRLSGAAARIKATNEKAVYVHCNSHVLNLCVASCCGQQLVQNMMNTVRVVAEFYNFSPKRFSHLTKKIKEAISPARHTHLIDVCRTRWVARLDGLDVFIELFSAIVDSMDEIKCNADRTWNNDSTQKASCLYHSITTFQFLVTLVIVSRILEVTRPLTKQLQSASMDAGAAREKVNLLEVMLEKMRVDVEKRHESWFSEAVTLAESVGTTPGKPRTTGRQVHRQNVPAESTTQYYCRSLSIPFLDYLISEIQTRFSNTNLEVMDALFGMPMNVVTKDDWKPMFSKFLETYKDDLPEPRYLATELEMWSEKCHLAESLPAKLTDVLVFADKLSFPNIYTAFKIFSTIPVTTCTCERSISSLRRLKTYLRNSMSENRLKGLALLNVHREINLDINKVIDRFAANNPRKMAFADILNSD